jgi:hypothetical protein
MLVIKINLFQHLKSANLLVGFVLSVFLVLPALATEKPANSNPRKNYPGAVDEEPIKVQDPLKDVDVKLNRRAMELKARDSLFKTNQKAKAENPQ